MWQRRFTFLIMETKKLIKSVTISAQPLVTLNVYKYDNDSFGYVSIINEDENLIESDFYLSEALADELVKGFLEFKNAVQ